MACRAAPATRIFHRTHGFFWSLHRCKFFVPLVYSRVRTLSIGMNIDEDVLLNDGFYSSPAAISLSSLNNQLANLRKQVNIPNSISSQSINTSLLNTLDFSLEVPQAAQKTSHMKNLPSLRALETILTQKAPKIDHIIEEEEDVSLPSIDPRASTISVQTFQTARSRSLDLIDAQPNSTSTKRTSITTIDESGYTSEDTPVISQPATFYTVRHSGKDFSPKVVMHSFDDTQDDTLTEHTDGLHKTPLNEKVVLAPPVNASQTSFPSPQLSHASIPSIQRDTRNITPKMTPAPTFNPQTPKASEPTDAETPRINTPKTIATVSTVHTDELTKSPGHKPKARSISSFSLAFKQKPAHKRLSTLSDLTKMKEETPKQKKKFSFKAFFKKKPDHKVASKSASTPNLAAFTEPKQKPQTRDTKQTDTKPLPSVKPLTDNDLPNSQVYDGPLKPRAFKSNTNMNLIREVSDDDFGTEKSDGRNLELHPPKQLSNARFDEEMALLPLTPPQTAADGFGSPFKVNYPPSIVTPSPERAPHHAASPVEKDLGETLFPKSLNAQEVESIVSLERSRSMRSVRSGKRNSFINYDGSDDNIIQGSTLPVSQPTSGITRSSSILKSLLSRALSDNITPSIDATIQPTPPAPADPEDNYVDLIEFQDFIDVDNLDFSLTPDRTASRTSLRAPSPEVEDDAVTHLQPVARELFASQVNTPPASQNLESSHLSPSPIFEKKKGAQPQPPQSQPPAEQPVTPQPNEYQGPESPESTIELPILSAALRTSTSTQPRPISMSFKGLKGPSFGETLAMHDIRSLDSHQSFNITFGDDTDSVGGGFGTELELDLDTSSYDKENRAPQKSTRTPSRPALMESQRNNVVAPPNFHHNKIPSISENSSPRSLSSFMTKMKKTPYSPSEATPRVRFSSRIILYDTYNGDEYDRHPDTATCNQLTPMLAQQIREELNTLKSEMEVHEDSRCYTYFF